jgi:hypothetical protein
VAAGAAEAQLAAANNAVVAQLIGAWTTTITMLGRQTSVELQFAIDGNVRVINGGDTDGARTYRYTVSNEGKKEEKENK